MDAWVSHKLGLVPAAELLEQRGRGADAAEGEHTRRGLGQREVVVHADERLHTLACTGETAVHHKPWTADYPQEYISLLTHRAPGPARWSRSTAPRPEAAVVAPCLRSWEQARKGGTAGEGAVPYLDITTTKYSEAPTGSGVRETSAWTHESSL